MECQKKSSPPDGTVRGPHDEGAQRRSRANGEDFHDEDPFSLHGGGPHQLDHQEHDCG